MSFCPNVVLSLVMFTHEWPFSSGYHVIPAIFGILVLLGLVRDRRPALSTAEPRLRREVIRVLSHAKPRPGPGNPRESESPGRYPNQVSSQPPERRSADLRLTLSPSPESAYA